MLRSIALRTRKKELPQTRKSAMEQPSIPKHELQRTYAAHIVNNKCLHLHYFVLYTVLVL